MNRLFIKNQVKVIRYKKKEGGETPPNNHGKRKRPEHGKEVGRRRGQRSLSRSAGGRHAQRTTCSRSEVHASKYAFLLVVHGCSMLASYMYF